MPSRAPFLRAYICSSTPRICSSSFSARIGLSLPELALSKNIGSEFGDSNGLSAVEDSNADARDQCGQLASPIRDRRRNSSVSPGSIAHLVASEAARKVFSREVRYQRP